jgi:lambda family phage tail tape measure protein
LKAAVVVGNLEDSFFELQKAALSVFAPIIGETDNFKLSAAQAEKIVKVLGAAVAIAFGATVVRNIIAVVSTLGTLVKVLRATAIAQAAVTALTGPAGWAVLAGAAVAAGAAIYGIDKALGEANKETIALGNSAKKTFGQLNAGKGGAFKGATGVTEQQAQAREKEALAAQQVTDQMKLQNDEANKLRQKSIDLIGVDTDRANLIKSNAQAESDGRKQVADLEAKIVAERAKGKGTNQEVIAQLEQQKNIVNGQVTEATRLNNVEYQRLQQLRLQNSELKNELEKIDLMVAAMRSVTEKEIRDQLLLGKIGKEEYDRKMTLHDAQTKNLSDIAKLEKSIRVEREKAIPDTTKIKEYEGEIKNLEIGWIKTKAAIEAANTTVDVLKESTAAGVRAALDNIGEQFKPYKMAQDAIMMGWNKVNDALDTFIQTGKFKFKDFASSIIGMLAKMVAQAMIFKYIFEPIMGALGLSSGTSAPIPIPGFANGGNPPVGKPSIVGEKGPELFVPKSAGTIIPNNKLPSGAQATGSGMVNAPITNNYITNNIQAVDAKSVAQLFAENRKTLLGSVEMARRELPYQMA